MKNLTLFILCIFCIFSCREGSDITTIIEDPIDDPIVIIKTSVSGIVSYPNGDLAKNIEVSLDNISVKTNEFGLFTFNNIELPNSNQTVTIDLPGYYKASRTFKPIPGNRVDLIIHLIAKQNSGSFMAGNGSNISGMGGYNIIFPPNVIKDESGSIYSGNVNVFSYWMDPTNENTFFEMPGDLSGIDVEGNLTSLLTFGMIIVELEADDGSPLNIVDGGNATLEFPIPSNIVNEAPSNIPLWYYDYEKNIWMEDGAASKSGNKYIGEVSHFTPWNVDVPIETINIEGSVFITNLRNSRVKIRISSEESTFVLCSSSAANGIYSTVGPLNELLLLELIDECGEVIYSESIGPFAEDAVIDHITSQSSSDNYYTISGIVNDCNGNPLANAEIGILDELLSSYQNMVLSDDQGYYEFDVLDCANENYSITYYDCENNLFQMNGITVEDDVTLPDVNVCDPSNINSHLSIFFDNQVWEAPFLLAFTYEMSIITEEPLVFDLTVTVINWMTTSSLSGNTLYDEANESHEMVLDLPNSGFRASGEATIDFEYSNGFLNDLNIHINASDIEIVDPLLFPGGIEEVLFKVVN